jgi:hypothetical protein
MTLPHKTHTAFALYRWKNPYIAVAEDRSAFMSLGELGLCFDWIMSGDVAAALATDFAPTGEVVHCDFSTMREIFDSVFTGGVRSGLVRFDSELRPRQLELSLFAQVRAEDGPEYLIVDLRHYQRLYREPIRTSGVTLAERAMLEVCTSTFAEFAATHGDTLREPPPPRYRAF